MFFVDGSYSEFMDVVSGVSQVSVQSHLMFVVYKADLFLLLRIIL
jgi:hypothetical protein